MAIEGILSTLDSLSTGASNAATGSPRITASASGAGDIVGIDDPNGGLDFGATLNRMMSAVETSNAQANQATLGMVDGTVDVHDAMIALQRADMTFQLTVQIRNKLVNAYQELMRMPV
jgi:flagellar hook-basal body complex protein FliE